MSIEPAVGQSVEWFDAAPFRGEPRWRGPVPVTAVWRNSRGEVSIVFVLLFGTLGAQDAFTYPLGPQRVREPIAAPQPCAGFAGTGGA